MFKRKTFFRIIFLCRQYVPFLEVYFDKFHHNLSYSKLLLLPVDFFILSIQLIRWDFLSFLNEKYFKYIFSLSRNLKLSLIILKDGLQLMLFLQSWILS